MHPDASKSSAGILTCLPLPAARAPALRMMNLQKWAAPNASDT
jgi:hypothetical protein